MSLAAQITAALQRLGVPIYGVSIGRADDRSTWRIDYAPGATDLQRSTAEALKLTYDPATDTAYTDEQATLRFTDEKLIKAVAIWTAQKLSVPIATARSEILTIYKGL